MCEKYEIINATIKKRGVPSSVRPQRAIRRANGATRYGGRRVSASFYFVSFRKASLRFVFQLFHLSHVWTRVFSEGCVTLRSGDNNRRNFYVSRFAGSHFLRGDVPCRAVLAIFQVSLPVHAAALAGAATVRNFRRGIARADGTPFENSGNETTSYCAKE